MIPLNRFHNYHVTSRLPGCDHRRQVIFQPSGAENTNTHVPSSAACKFTAPWRVWGRVGAARVQYDFVKAASVDVEKRLSRLFFPRLLLYPNKRDNGSDDKQGHRAASRWEATQRGRHSGLLKAAAPCRSRRGGVGGHAPQGEGSMRPNSN